MKIIDLYKIHINADPEAYEIHSFMTSFGLNGIIIRNPLTPELEAEKEKTLELCKRAAIDWIFKNSKLQSKPHGSNI